MAHRHTEERVGTAGREPDEDTADEVARTIVSLGSLANGHTTGELLRADGFFVTPPRAMKPPA